MRIVRLWDDYPGSREEALGRIREEIGANRQGYAYVDAPDNSVVEVDSNWVYQHFFVDHDRDRRWEYVPAIVPAIQESDDWEPVPGRKGRVAYLSTLEIVRPNRKGRQHIQTIADRKSTRFKKWVTAYPTRRGAPGQKETAGNPKKDARPSPGVRNPTPVLVGRPGASRSGRPPGTVDSVYHSREGRSSPWRDVLLLSGLTLAVGLLGNHMTAEVPT